MLKEVIREVNLREINEIVDEIRERARIGGDSNAIEIIEKYVYPVVQEHLSDAKLAADKARKRMDESLS